ncbi:mechanosensitive ion channel family protein [Methanosarcina hadiensis]|uniref:mechanosensitive ion channel family protein n=1 Tax=Methanosarcina hadiensis TaxID=3078083 RepID=UPI00397781BB
METLETLDTLNETLETLNTTLDSVEAPTSFVENMSYLDRIMEHAFVWFSDNLGTLLFIILIGMGTILVARTVNNIMTNYHKRASTRLHIDVTTFRMFRHIMVAAVYFIGLVVTIFSIPSLRDLSVAMLSGAGLAGIVIGFAAQNTLSNIIAGIALAIFQPFRVGDRLTIMNEYGKVTDLNLRHTVIITADNRRLIIPNSVISSEAIVNWTIEDSAVIWAIDVGIGYDSDISLAKKIMIEEARKHPKVMSPHTLEYSVVKPGILKSDILANGFINPSVLHAVDPDFRERGQIKVYVTELGEFAINLRVHMWFKDRSDAYGAGCEIREAIKMRFDQEGIEIPYPYRTIVYKKDLEKPSRNPAQPEEIKVEYAPGTKLTSTGNEKGI